MNVFYAIGSHWDREWYKPFQCFRYDLVKMMDRLIEALENEEINIFTFDGQTIVFEDYTEIKPNKERIVQLVKDGRLKIGPWYVMPDELLVSGESLIKNFIIGKKVAEEYGGDVWKYGYMNDIFGHIAQMPQILKNVGINAAYLGRGLGKKEYDFKNFIWESPDGSRVFAYKETYGNLIDHLWTNNCTVDSVEAFIKDNVDLTDCVLLNYTFDHITVDQDLLNFEKAIKALKGKYKVEEGLDKISDSLIPYVDRLLVQEGELITTAEDSTQFRAVTHSISSYYPLKKENDICENLLEAKLCPMLTIANLKGIRLEYSFCDLAYKYLLKNQPHDSICGCSTDVVHRDMLYRYSQIKSICNAYFLDYYNQIAAFGEQKKEFSIEIQNYEPFSIHGSFVTTVYFPTDWECKVIDISKYQKINGFQILDENGVNAPYQILSIEKGYSRKNVRSEIPVDAYTIVVEAPLHSFGGTTFKVVAGKNKNYINLLSDGDLCAENEFLCAEINNDGSITLTDKKSGRVYKNLNTFVDDGEIGNGWFSAQPIGSNSMISSKGSYTNIEIINNGYLVKRFRITKVLSIPKDADYNNYCRNEECADLKIVTVVTLKNDSKSLEFETTVYNNSYDHRLRMEFPTGISGNNYYASQAFTFIERSRGITEKGADFFEPESCEKNTSGIVLVNDKYGGFAFVGKEGFHEAGVTKNGVISVTMFRSFGRIMFSGNLKSKDAQLIGEHKFRYALSIETDMPALLRIKNRMMHIYDNVCVLPDKKSNSYINVKGNVAVSIIKPSENGKGNIIRLYNPTMNDEKAEIDFNFAVENTKYVNALEEEIVAVKTENNKVVINMKPQKITTLYFEKA